MSIQQLLSSYQASADPYWSSVSLLLHMDGANGATSFPDVSATPKIVTANGNAQISTAQSKFGGASAMFDGNGDFLTVPANAAFDLDTGNFTIEAYVRFAGYSPNYGAAGYGAAIVATYSGAAINPKGWQVRINGTASSYTTINVYTGTTDLNFTAPFALNSWDHVAVTRNSGQVRAFVNGTQVGSTIANTDSFSGSVAGSRPLYIGGLNDSSFRMQLNGFIDELRITKGVARYVANFTPPASPFPNS